MHGSEPENTQKIWMDHEGILHEVFHVVVSKDAVQAAILQRQAITSQPCPTMIHAEHIIDVEYEGLQLACTEAAVRATPALAIIAKGAVANFHAKAFVRYHKPGYPVRIFLTEEDAREWLQDYRTADEAMLPSHPPVSKYMHHSSMIH